MVNSEKSYHTWISFLSHVSIQFVLKKIKKCKLCQKNSSHFSKEIHLLKIQIIQETIETMKMMTSLKLLQAITRKNNNKRITTIISKNKQMPHIQRSIPKDNSSSNNNNFINRINRISTRMLKLIREKANSKE